MSDVSVAPVAPASEAVPVLSPANEPQALTVDSAYDALQKFRSDQNKPIDPVVPPAKPEGDEVPDEQGTAQETAPGETAEASAEVELPPIEPPRSWPKEDKEIFATLPRETQANLADRERRREADFNRRQQEAAETQKAIQAERAKAEQARQQYENAYPQLIETVRSLQSGQFADIKSHADAQALAQTDPARYVQYLAHQQGLAQMEADAKAIQERQVQEHRAKWQEFATREDKLLLEKAPELADQEVLDKTSKAALRTLKDVGFAEDELAKAWNGEMAISPRDHRFQVLVYEASKYRELKANPPKPSAKPIPPVQKPGIATSKSDQSASQINALKDKLKSAKGIEAARIATDLYRAQRAARG